MTFYHVKVLSHNNKDDKLLKLQSKLNFRSIVTFNATKKKQIFVVN